MSDLKTYPGIDLRSKVVGARLLIRGMNPYYEFRHESHPDRLRMLNDDTYSPALLLLYAPLCELAWRTQRIIYFCADWIAVFLCYVLLSRVFPKDASATALWASFVFLFVAGFGFRLHLERGQYYVELAFLTSVASACLLRKYNSWFYSFLLAILVLLRPTYAICMIGLLVLRKTRHAACAALLCVLLFAATLPLTGLGNWKSYFAEIGTNQRELLDAAYGLTPQPASATASKVIEGIDFSKSLTYPGYLADRTLIGLARSSVSPVLARLVHRIAPSERDFDWLNSGCLLLVGGFDIGVLYGLRRRCASGLISIAFVFLAPLNLELFAPQRFPYCDVTILAPVLLILAAALQKPKKASWVLYGVILTTGAALPWLSVHFDRHAPLASLFSYAGILAALNIVCIIEAWGPRSYSIMGAVPEHKEIGYCTTA